MEAAWRVNRCSLVRHYGHLIMWTMFKSMGRMALLYRYRTVILRCVLCFTIFAVIELVFMKWESLIQQLSFDTQMMILTGYSISQLVLLIIVILSFTRPQWSPSRAPESRPRKQQRASQTEAVHSLSHQVKTDDKVNSKIDALLDTERYPDLQTLHKTNEDNNNRD